MSVTTDGEVTSQAIVLSRSRLDVHGDNVVAGQGNCTGSVDGDSPKFLVFQRRHGGTDGLDTNSNLFVLERGQEDVILVTSATGGDRLAVFFSDVEVDTVLVDIVHHNIGGIATEVGNAIAIQTHTGNGDFDTYDVVGNIGSVLPLNLKQRAEIVEFQFLATIAIDDGTGRELDILFTIDLHIFLPTRQMDRLVGITSEASLRNGVEQRSGISGTIDSAFTSILNINLIGSAIKGDRILGTIDIHHLARSEEDGIVAVIDIQFTRGGGGLHLDTKGNGIHIFLAAGKKHGASGGYRQEKYRYFLHFDMSFLLINVPIPTKG